MVSHYFPPTSAKNLGTLEHSKIMSPSSRWIKSVSPMSSLCGNSSVALLLTVLGRLKAKSLRFLSKYFEVVCVQTYLRVSFEVLMMYSEPSTKLQLVLSHHYFHGHVPTVASVPNLIHGCFYGQTECMCLEYLYVYSTYKMYVDVSVLCIYIYIYITEI